MHGMKKNYVMTAIILLFLAGCSTDVKESDIKFAGETGVKVSFSAVINNSTGSTLAPTRATDTQWEVGDSIDQKTSKGNDPTWSTVKSRYWKN